MLSRLLSRLFPFPVGLIILSLGSIATAQQGETVTGKVMDPNKAAVMGALIVAQGEGSSVPTTATTNQRGEFSFTAKPGSYDLTATAEGFAICARTLNVKLNTRPPLEVVLEGTEPSPSVTIPDPTGYRTQAVSSATKSAT